MPKELNIGDYEIIRPNKAWKHKIGSAWIGHMPIVDTTSEMVFVVEDVLRTEKLMVHAQNLISYSVK